MRFKEQLIEEKKLFEEKKEGFEVMLKNDNDKIQVRDIFQTLEIYEKKTFKGLDLEQEIPVSLAVQGLKGIASEYNDEKEKK